MQILLVAATKFEIEPFLKQNKTLDFLITGVGTPGSIYHLTKRLHQLDYDLVIQAGIAGSFTKNLQLGEVVLVDKDAFADLGISETGNFHTVFEKGFADKDFAPFTNGWLKNSDELLKQFDLKKVKAITVNTVGDNELQTNMLISKYDPEIETMEGAALHYVCLNEQVPFLQLRSISNYVGERNKLEWRMEDAFQNLREALTNVIRHLYDDPNILPPGTTT